MTEDEFWDSLASVDRDLDLNAFQHWQKLKEVVASTNPNLDECGASLEEFSVFVLWRIFCEGSEDDSPTAIPSLELASMDKVVASLEAFKQTCIDDAMVTDKEFDYGSMFDLVTEANRILDS